MTSLGLPLPPALKPQDHPLASPATWKQICLTPDISLALPGPRSPLNKEQPLLEAVQWAKAVQGWGQVNQGLGEGLGRNGGSLTHSGESLFHRMIPKEQKGPVMAAMGDLAGPGKAARKQQSPPLSAGPCAQVAKGPEGENDRSELHVFSALPGGPTDGQAAAPPAEGARSPSALAPGYAEPLREVPREKFNHTAIPKGYRCPWQEFVSSRDKGDGRSHNRSLVEYRNFNK
ncbi:hypothetical protein MC885_008760 [Smutsia gigantea]|nr:hypothetical protein MC885_008760 [Smutsia gigantea]